MDNAASQITKMSKTFEMIQERGRPVPSDFEAYCLPEHGASIIHVSSDECPPFQREYNQCREGCA